MVHSLAMPHLLLELGCEELPASQVASAVRQFADRVGAFLQEHDFGGTLVGQYGTPRRLIVAWDGVAPMEPDREVEQRGPSLKVAYDAEGNPSKALEGFCRGQGVDPSELEQRDDYVWVTKKVAGRSLNELLGEKLEGLILGIHFDKTMRWGSGRTRFARPIRWVLAAFDGQLVRARVGGVATGLKSRGHRFYAPTEFEATNFTRLVQDLRARFVEPDPEVRRERIRDGAKRVAAPDRPELTPELVDENVYLTEWPDPLRGDFDEDFLELPEPVLVTAMAKHERFFPVRDAGGKITRSFISVRNSGEESTVRSGNGWVLGARFNDARYFFREDQKLTLADFLEKTKGMTFQEQLGSVHDRTERFQGFRDALAAAVGLEAEEGALLKQALQWAKADLSSGLVSELSSLQGVIGGEYARREGLPEPVCQAIARQYQFSQFSAPESAADRLATAVTIADQVDKLAGYLGIGKMPSGSSDPFGLRRAAGALVEIAWANPRMKRGYLALFEAAIAQYQAQEREFDPTQTLHLIRDLFAGRYELALRAPIDVREAALTEESAVLNPREVRLRTEILSNLRSDVAFVQTATRPLNILAAAAKKGESVTPGVPLDALQSEEGATLAAALEAQSRPLNNALEAEDAQTAAGALKELEPPIHVFFEATMIMHEEPAVRAARLGLVARVAEVLRRAGDWSQLTPEA